MTPDSFYLGPTAGRWAPETWEDFVSAAADGLLDESSWVELKEDVPAAAKGSNLETAKDLASLSIDGGLFLVGIRDAKGHAGDVVGVENAEALADRLGQIAATRVGPALAVRPHIIRRPNDTSKACVAVAVPASPEAPHMVDNKYWGRSNDGKRMLNDPEIRRLHEASSLRHQSFERDLTTLAETFDPIPRGIARAGHVFLLARPLTSIGELSAQVAAAWPQMVSHATGVGSNWSGLNDAVIAMNHPDGPAATTTRHPGRMDRDGFEEFVHTALIRDRGRVGDIQAFSGAGTFPQPDGPATVSPLVMVQLVQQLLLLADYVGRKQFGTDAGWQVGFHVTGLSGAVGQTPTPGTPPYPHSSFTHSETITAAELAEQSAVITKRIVGPLMRGLGLSWSVDSYSGPDDLRMLRR
jgi:hypothetical protein